MMLSKLIFFFITIIFLKHESKKAFNLILLHLVKWHFDLAGDKEMALKRCYFV